MKRWHKYLIAELIAPGIGGFVLSSIETVKCIKEMEERASMEAEIHKEELDEAYREMCEALDKMRSEEVKN